MKKKGKKMAKKKTASKKGKKAKVVAKIKTKKKPAIKASKKASAQKKSKTVASKNTKIKPIEKKISRVSPHVTTKINQWIDSLKPLDNRILVQLEEKAKVTAGGLYIPDLVTDVSGNFRGKVLSVGRGHMNKKGKVKPMDVKVGDTVVFSQFSGSRIEQNGLDFMVLRESEILGIVKG